MSIQGKKIVLGITGSIAAYKTPHLVRLLVKMGALVKVVMTPAAEDFVSKLSLATVSKNPVLSSLNTGSEWNNHVELGLWADVVLIAPCSANTLAKLANGICDNLLTAVYLSARCAVFVAPAMDADMWKHPATQVNLKTIKEYGNRVIPVETGELASGLTGEGRMAEPENILTVLSEFFCASKPALHGIKTLVNAGPTYERIDPVRFIGNFSTGKMGIALAETLAENGADVTLVIGPVSYQLCHPNIKVKEVESAAQMYAACLEAFPSTDIAILAAAVADFKPETMADEKIKKAGSNLTINLTSTDDILMQLGKIKQTHQTLVGFALETTNELENAQNKLVAKNADMIVLNSLRDAGAGFGGETNKVTIITKGGGILPLPLKSKMEVAELIVEHIIKYRGNESSN